MFKAIIIVLSFSVPAPMQIDDPYLHKTLPECWVRASEVIRDIVLGPFPVISAQGICIKVEKSENVGPWTMNH
jgi:hypothetical protein